MNGRVYDPRIGFRFTVADLSAAVGAFRLVESGELPLESFIRILGLQRTPGEADLAAVTQTAGRISRGVR
jgi:hypothetical protein